MEGQPTSRVKDPNVSVEEHQLHKPAGGGPNEVVLQLHQWGHTALCVRVSRKKDQFYRREFRFVMNNGKIKKYYLPSIITNADKTIQIDDSTVIGRLHPDDAKRMKGLYGMKATLFLGG